jgi:hypothetical protein
MLCMCVLCVNTLVLTPRMVWILVRSDHPYLGVGCHSFPLKPYMLGVSCL